MDEASENSTVVFLDKYTYIQSKYEEPSDDKLYVYTLNNEQLFHIFDNDFVECFNDDSELEYEVFAKKIKQQTISTLGTVLEPKICKFCIDTGRRGNKFALESKECELCEIKREESFHNSEDHSTDITEHRSTESHSTAITEDGLVIVSKSDYIYLTDTDEYIKHISGKEKVDVPISEKYELIGSEDIHKKLETYAETKHEFKIYDSDVEDRYISEPESEQDCYYSMDNSSKDGSFSDSEDKEENHASKYCTESNIFDPVLQDPMLDFFNVIKVECGYLIMNRVMLSDYNWHTIIVNQRDAQCTLCQEEFNTALIPLHVQTDNHKKKLTLYLPLDKYGYSITRKIGPMLHCGVCNELCSEDDWKIHVSEKSHKASLNFATESFSSYPESLTDNNLYVILVFPKMEVKLPLENWNMAHNARITFYCLLCQNNYPKVSMREHFNNIKHREGLLRCRLVSQLGEHTLRMVNLTFHHCGVCNMFVYGEQIQGHITSSSHLVAIERHTVFFDDKPRGGLFESAVLAVFGSVIYVNKYDLHTIMYQTFNVICASCNMILGENEVVGHLDTPYHVAKMKTTPFLPLYGLDLIRLLNIDTLHCCVCNVLLPNLIGTLGEHVYSVRHLLFKKQTLNPHTAVNPSFKYVSNNKEIIVDDVACKKEDKSIEFTEEKIGEDVRQPRLNVEMETNMVFENKFPSSEIKSMMNKVVAGEMQSDSQESNIDMAICKQMAVKELKRHETVTKQLDSQSNLKDVINTEASNNAFEAHDVLVNRITDKEDDRAVKVDSKNKSIVIYVDSKELKLDIIDNNELGEENLEIEIIGEFLDDSKDLYSSPEIDIEKYVNVIFNQTHTKILRVSWDTLINSHDEFHCLICEVSILRDNITEHVNNLVHQKNVMKKGFLLKYGENLIRKFDNICHCAVCNLPVHKSVEDHINWRMHGENLHLAKKRSESSLDVAEFKTSVVAVAKTILEKFKPVKIHIEHIDVGLTINWCNWQGIQPFEHGFACLLCKSEFRIDELTEHVNGKEHNGHMAFTGKYVTNLIREIDACTLHCAICNRKLLKNGDTELHINGARHKKNMRISKISNVTI